MNVVFPVKAVVKDTETVKGRGVFATTAFVAGELVESCPVIVLYQSFDLLAPKLQRVVYNWGKLAKMEPCTALPLGYGSLYNHANPANMMYRADVENQTLNYFAARDIVDGEELSVNYNSGGQPEYEKNTWFDNKGIDLIVD
jgi:hypothetical protein